MWACNTCRGYMYGNHGKKGLEGGNKNIDCEVIILDVKCHTIA